MLGGTTGCGKWGMGFNGHGICGEEIKRGLYRTKGEPPAHCIHDKA